MIERRREMGGNILPYAYEVEYLESSGTQWIDTGVFPHIDFEAEFKFAYTRHSSTSSFGVIGCTDGVTSHGCWIAWPNQAQFGDVWSGQLPSFTTALYYKINRSKFTADIIETTFNSGNINTGLNSWTMFCVKGWSNYNNIYVYGKLYFLKIKNDGIIMDFIPVVDTQGVPAMYDKVSGQLFYNQGTGQFIAGPRVRGGGQ